jgi:hypothetical protein
MLELIGWVGARECDSCDWSLSFGPSAWLLVVSIPRDDKSGRPRFPVVSTHCVSCPLTMIAARPSHGLRIVVWPTYVIQQIINVWWLARLVALENDDDQSTTVIVRVRHRHRWGALKHGYSVMTESPATGHLPP